MSFNKAANHTKATIHDGLKSYDEAFQKEYFIESTKKTGPALVICCTNDRRYRVKGN